MKNPKIGDEKMFYLRLLVLAIALVPTIVLSTPSNAQQKTILVGKTKTVWEASNVMGKICIDPQGITVNYWFIKNGRNYKTRTTDRQVCLNVDPKLFQELRVQNDDTYVADVLVWDDVSGVGILLAPIVSLEELGKAVGDGLKDFERSLRHSLESTFNINVAKGQKGLGCYLVDGEPQVGTRDGVRWASWKTGQIITPTTSKGRNMRLTGFELRLQEDGEYSLTSGSFANLSRHSNWDSSLIVKPGILINGKFEEVAKPFQINFGQLRHGNSNKRKDSGSFTATPAEYEKLDSKNGRIFVCLRTNRYS